MNMFMTWNISSTPELVRSMRMRSPETDSSSKRISESFFKQNAVNLMVGLNVCDPDIFRNYLTNEACLVEDSSPIG